MDAFNYRAFTCTIIKAELNTFENSGILFIIIKTLRTVLLYKHNLGILFSLKQSSDSLLSRTYYKACSPSTFMGKGLERWKQVLFFKVALSRRDFFLSSNKLNYINWCSTLLKDQVEQEDGGGPRIALHLEIHCVIQTYLIFVHKTSFWVEEKKRSVERPIFLT